MDLISIAVGAIAGGAIGYIAASIRLGVELDQLQELYECLYREYCRLTDRDERGRFVGKGNRK